MGFGRMILGAIARGAIAAITGVDVGDDGGYDGGYDGDSGSGGDVMFGSSDTGYRYDTGMTHDGHAVGSDAAGHYYDSSTGDEISKYDTGVTGNS